MEKQKMIIWSPSSWALWKQCPAKYRIKQLERWKYPKPKEDKTLSKLAIPGLVVDKLLQLWLYRNSFEDKLWFEDNFEMIWSMVNIEISPNWSIEEAEATKGETKAGLINSVMMLETLNLSQYQLIIQANFFDKIEDTTAITGSADLLLIDDSSGKGILIDFKNNHSRQRVTKDQLVIYQLGLESKFSIAIPQAGYMMFNPRLNDWKWFNLANPAHKEKMMKKLIAASEHVIDKQFDYNWNKFTCHQFCEVRFSCDMFQNSISRKPYQFKREEI